MKKLMFAAMAVAAAGVASADPLVYDYKASTKQMNLKTKQMTVAGVKLDIYVKYQASASLKGYLIVDTDGATSSAIQTRAGSGSSVPATCPFDYGRNRAFLVVQNSKAEKEVRFPKIIPAVIDAKWSQDKANATSGIAEGYLYAGGELKAGQVRPAIDIYNNALSETRTANAAAGFIQDYCWTSVYLFGNYNGPLFFINSWDAAETAIEAAMDADLVRPFAAGDYFFHDSWLNGAGFGKWSTGKNKKPCCGQTIVAGKTLDSLSGNLKGGLFLCTEPGTNLEGAYVRIYNWEEQFLTDRWDLGEAGVWTTAGDYDQTDLWQDGGLELNTRDCISGTWSIKFTQKLSPVTITNDEIDDLNGGAGLYTEDAKGLKVLMNTIKGAALALNKNVKFATGNEIWDEVTAFHDQVTFLTPKFCKYYGLLNWK